MTETTPSRRRPLIAVPGWLLLACLFMPALRVCGDPTMPIEFPPTYLVYVGGGLIAVMAMSRSLVTRRRCVVLMMTLWSLTFFVIGSSWLGDVNGGAGVLAAVFALVCQIVLTRRWIRTAWSERAVALVMMFHAIVAAGWNALLAFDPDGMWGADVGLAASVALLIASGAAYLDERAELVRKQRETEPAPLPEARAIWRG